MKTYEITLKPLSGFGTPLKGDTLFGHICWQAAYDEGLFGNSIDMLLARYSTEPFLIVSSVFFKVRQVNAVSRYFKRPDMPVAKLFVLEDSDKRAIIQRRKEFKSKRWMKLDEGERIGPLKKCTFISDSELFETIMVLFDETTRRESRKKGLTSTVNEYLQPHNSINRLTNRTGEGQFAPFTTEQRMFLDQVELALFVGVANNIAVDCVRTAFDLIGITGFGRDASTGLGKFSVTAVTEVDLFGLGSEKANACFTLAPSVPEQNMYRDIYFTPFTRFGKHGDVLSKSSKPFKNPVIMADEGAVFVPHDTDAVFMLPYIGKAIGNISKAEPGTVAQGYSLYIPINVEA